MTKSSDELLQSDIFSLHSCPKCHRHSLLQMNTKFRCLSCEYYRDLATPKATKTSSSELPGAIIIAIVLVAFVLFIVP